MKYPILDLVGVSGRYFMVFVETLIKNSHKFHTLVGCILHHEEETLGHAYIFSGHPGSGKTSIMRLLEKTLYGCRQAQFIHDCNPNKVNIDWNKTYFIETNLPKEKITLSNYTIFEMSEMIFPIDLYKQFMLDIESFSNFYKLICDSMYREWRLNNLTAFQKEQNGENTD